MKKLMLFVCAVGLIASAHAQEEGWKGKFEQLGTELPTPNSYRTSSGAPGAKYWQQRADYSIDVEVNDETQLLTGKETITYYNNSPDVLTYLWMQLDQNVRAAGSMAQTTGGSSAPRNASTKLS